MVGAGIPVFMGDKIEEGQTENGIVTQVAIKDVKTKLAKGIAELMQQKNSRLSAQSDPE